ncbi:YesL family protein [Ruminococcus flavefaciens]|uniref:Uncharacterized membrane protein YesL n=1 Tax=Ruminococcus flavefaciens TaxID=1265 RepID=A0A1M7H733_RUMFL|nr:DUF624 domain-containing protein [Ruminococcus flavefaciens]SHM24159.1 Uncharacterized membrane protein YesL [Ruminococcus flavefaciens]
MGLFKSNETTGAGISKNAPKKKGFSLFWDIFCRKFWKLMEINLLYMLFFIPLLLIFPAISLFEKNYYAAMTSSVLLILIFMVLIGPATAGMTKIMRKFVINKHSFIMQDFFKGFKENFKKSVIIGFIDCLVVISAYAALNVYPVFAVQETRLYYIPLVITFSLFLVIIMMNHYIYLMLTATNLSMKNLFKNSFALSFVAMKQNLLVFIIGLAFIVLMYLLFVYLMPVFFLLIAFFPAALICLINSFVCYPVIQKYVINPYYTSIGEINPELVDDTPTEEERIFEDMGGLEKPVEKRKKGKGKRIS